MINDSYFAPNKCLTCVHYGFYRMITNGLYGYDPLHDVCSFFLVG